MKDIHNWIILIYIELYLFVDILNCELFIIELWIYNVYASKYMYHNWIVYFYIIELWISIVKHIQLWIPITEL